MTDYSELKLLAEAATGFTDMSLAPDVVLALIAENERMQSKGDGQHHRDSAELRSLCQERDQLKAENEALRKDAERYRWLLNNADLMHWENMLRFADLEGVESINQFIDAAMSKGEQP
ncbi:hypothetical protein [Pseudomonas chlororaphis]|uniref:hypothetical protein n=1 Tax=Pseudomonas chlororaphis TaxID=587753 RepID=UPI000BE41258|nr:hypothetical protein [Pseudomonas chlororaphis]